MLKNIIAVPYISVLYIIFLLLFASCNTYKTLPYFHDFPDSSRPTLALTVPFKNPVIQPDDVLSITIETLDQDVTNFLNKTATGISTSGSATVSAQQGVSGYLVDRNGEVELPFTGTIKLSGLTTAEARDTIKTRVSKYFNQPVVNVRFANFKITLLGEVARPATYTVPNEKINLLDALSMGGDITIFGKKENILLLRDTLEGDKKMIRLNLTSKDITGSPYFYLRPNDIVYVEPNKYKTTEDALQRNRSIISITASLVTLILARIILK